MLIVKWTTLGKAEPIRSLSYSSPVHTTNFSGPATQLRILTTFDLSRVNSRPVCTLTGWCSRIQWWWWGGGGCTGSISPGKYQGGGGSRHPWKFRSSSCLTHPLRRASACTIQSQRGLHMKSPASIGSQHLKESVALNTGPKATVTNADCRL